MTGYYLSIYISTREADLMDIYRQIGLSKMRTLIKLTLRSLFNPAIVKTAKDFYYQNTGSNNEVIEDNETLIIRLSLNKESDENIRYLLEKLKPRKKGAFIKQVLRYTLGPEIIYPLFLLSDETILSQNYTHLLFEGLYTNKETKSNNKAKNKHRKTKQKSSTKTFVKEVVKTKPDQIIEKPSTNEETYSKSTYIEDTKGTEEINNTPASTTEEDDMIALLNNLLG